MAACSLPVQSQCYLLNSSPVSTIDRYEICEQKLRAYLGNAADYTRLTITDDMWVVVPSLTGFSNDTYAPVSMMEKAYPLVLVSG